MTLWLIAALAAGTFAMRFGGAAAGSTLSESSQRAMALVPIAMLAALAAVQTFYGADGVELDARALGVAAGAIALFLRAPFVVVVAVAAGVAAGGRWLGL